MSEGTAAAEAPSEGPKSLLDRVGAALPIALTALATAFAGLSTTELQRSMFWRSYAAQDQAKATSQWTLAGFKRDRALICQAAAAQLRATVPAGRPAAALPAGPNAEASAWLAGNGPPRVTLPPPEDAQLVELLERIRTRAPDAAVTAKARKIPADAVNAEIDRAEKFVEQVDHDWMPTLDAADELVKSAAGPAATPTQAAGFELDRRRYRAESSLNQGVGYLYEARVKISSVQSEKHQSKSENFFYAMLAAQVGATVSALGLARRHKSLLWTVAGLTGAVAVLIAGYVYLSDM